MIVSLMPSEKIALMAWAPYVHSRAVYAQRTGYRSTRRCEHARIEVHALYGLLLQQALAMWGNHRLYLAVKQSM